MRLGPKILTAAALLLAAGLSWLAASLGANAIESRSGAAVRSALAESGHGWAEVHTDGLLVHMGGEAPTEAARFAALSTAGRVVEAERVIDGTTVTPARPLAPPRLSMEILRHEGGISLIGLVPQALDRESMAEEIRALAEGAEVTDLLQSTEAPVPEGWVQALNFALDALARMPRAKISVAPGRVTVEAVAASREEQIELTALLERRTPRNLTLVADIAAPRPVIAPFTLRFLSDGTTGRFDACAADTERDRDRILAAARAVGLDGAADCTLALGVPSPEWANAVILGIEAVDELGGGALAFSDADVSLVAQPGTDPALFDRVVGALESNLPEVFSLTATLPEPEEETGERLPPPEFTATRSPEGQVQLRGRLPNALVHDTVESFARARFGVEQVYMAARVTDGLPESWPVRVLAGLTALSELDHGAVIVGATSLEVRGTTGNPDARAEIARLLTDKLEEPRDFTLDVSYDAALDPLAGLPTPAECVGKINAILEGQKITFAPGSTAVEGPSAAVVDRIADVLRDCRKVEMEVEIAGHTDSQGREEMNLELSQARAEGVLEALLERRAPVSGLTARGYGETLPIADNDTEDGREANRRIEFRLLTDQGETPAADRTGEDETAEEAGE